MTQQMHDIAQERKRNIRLAARSHEELERTISTNKPVVGEVFRTTPDSAEEWIVENAKMDGGSSGGRGGMDSDWPDGWHVYARRLDADGNYDPDGVKWNFYMSGSFSDMIKQVWLTGRKFKKVITFVE